MTLPAAFLSGAGTWEAALAAALLAGVLSLDDTALAQTWLSQPLPAALLTGLIFGDAQAGLAVGLPLQMILVGNLPVGQSFTGDAVAGVVAAVGAAAHGGWRLLQWGQDHRPAPALDQLGLLGWLLLAAGLLSMAAHPLIQAERRAHGIWMQAGRLSLRDGSLPRLEGLHARCLGLTFLRGAVLAGLLLPLLEHWWLPAYARLGGGLQRALALLPLLLPTAGVGAMLERYGPRRSWRWFVAGAVVAFAAVKLGG